MLFKRFEMKWVALILLGMAVLLGACSNGNGNGADTNGGTPAGNSAADNGETDGTSANGGDSGKNTDNAASETAQPDTGKAAYPRTVKDARGTVTLKEQPKKVALAHWGLSDDLLVFDLDSMALTLPFTKAQSSLQNEVYKPIAAKHDSIEIVGENTKVNLEALLAYGPDLIIAGSETNKDILDQLSNIATTVVVDETATDVYKNWKSVITEFGEILGQEEVAKQYISDFEAKLTEGKDKLQAIDGTVVFVQVREKQVWLQGTSYLSEYYDGLGLTPPTGDTAKDGAELSLEGLTQLDPDYMFLGYFNKEDTSLPALTDEWEKSEVWKSLKAVKNGHVYGINGQIAFGFGPISKAYGVDEVVKAFQ